MTLHKALQKNDKVTLESAIKTCTINEIADQRANVLGGEASVTAEVHDIRRKSYSAQQTKACVTPSSFSEHPSSF